MTKLLDEARLRLATEKERFQKLRSTYIGFIIALSIFLVALIVLGALIYSLVLTNVFWHILTAALGLIFLFVIIAYFTEYQTPYWELREKIADLQNDIDLLEVDDVSETQSSYKLFKIQETDVKRYYNQALSHARFIFWIGLAIVIFGLTIIVFTGIQVAYRPHDSLEKIALASVGGVTGLLVNFVGLVFIRMFGATITSLRDFHGRLIATHHLLFGNIIAARISNKHLRDEAWALMAVAIAKGAAVPGKIEDEYRKEEKDKSSEEKSGKGWERDNARHRREDRERDDEGVEEDH
jgi:hypothetical protein